MQPNGNIFPDFSFSSTGDWVEVETDSGPKNGIVVFGPNQILHSNLDCSKMRLLGKVAKPFGQ